MRQQSTSFVFIYCQAYGLYRPSKAIHWPKNVLLCSNSSPRSSLSSWESRSLPRAYKLHPHLHCRTWWWYIPVMLASIRNCLMTKLQSLVPSKKLPHRTVRIKFRNSVPRTCLALKNSYFNLPEITHPLTLTCNSGWKEQGPYLVMSLCSSVPPARCWDNRSWPPQLPLKTKTRSQSSPSWLGTHTLAQPFPVLCNSFHKVSTFSLSFLGQLSWKTHLPTWGQN